jgi:hypothetical protein
MARLYSKNVNQALSHAAVYLSSRNHTGVAAVASSVLRDTRNRLRNFHDRVPGLYGLDCSESTSTYTHQPLAFASRMQPMRSKPAGRW